MSAFLKQKIVMEKEVYFFETIKEKEDFIKMKSGEWKITFDNEKSLVIELMKMEQFDY